MEQTLLRNTCWSIVPGSSPESLSAQVRQTCSDGLPNWLRKGRGNKETDSNQPPRLFCSVESKCFDDSGKHTCTKPHHSCLRRLDSKHPSRAPWKLIARALDVILSVVSCGVSVASLKGFGPRKKVVVNAFGAVNQPMVGALRQPISTKLLRHVAALTWKPLLERAFLDEHPEGFVSVKKVPRKFSKCRHTSASHSYGVLASFAFMSRSCQGNQGLC